MGRVADTDPKENPAAAGVAAAKVNPAIEFSLELLALSFQLSDAIEITKPFCVFLTL